MGGNLQAALDAARPGDTINLQAGAIFTGNFTLPVKNGSEYITIRSSRASELPVGRIGPQHAPLMPKIRTLNTEPAIKTLPGSSYWNFVGIEIIADPATENYGIILLGDGSNAQNTLSQVPHHITIDRCYVHGTNKNVQRGIAANSAHSTVINSYISQVHWLGADTQAIGGWNGPGPFSIVNNYLEAAGENVMFGGAEAAIPNLIPSDIEIINNHFFKPLSWQIGHPTYAGNAWTVKNLFELKNAQRVLVDGNLFENCWAHAQVGFGIVFTPRGNDGANPWATVRDVQFINNVIKNSQGGMNFLGLDEYGPSQQQQNILVRNNLFLQMGDGPLFQVGGPVANLTIDHNTSAANSGNTMTAYGAASANFRFSNNIVQKGAYGFIGDDVGSGTAAINRYFPSSVVQKNVFIGEDCAYYPPGNFCPANISQVGFADQVNYLLSPSSPYKGQGTDGLDLGRVLELPDPSPTPSPTPTIAPTPSPAPLPSTSTGVLSFTLVNADTDQDLSVLTDGSVINLSILPSQNLNVRANVGSGVSSVQFSLNGQVIRTELAAPYALAGDQNGDYDPWTPAIGNHTLLAVPNSGPSLSISFTVTQASPTPTPTPTPVPSPTPFWCGDNGRDNRVSWPSGEARQNEVLNRLWLKRCRMKNHLSGAWAEFEYVRP